MWSHATKQIGSERLPASQRERRTPARGVYVVFGRRPNECRPSAAGVHDIKRERERTGDGAPHDKTSENATSLQLGRHAWANVGADLAPLADLAHRLPA